MKHRSPTEEPDNSNERWLVSYADFITLMFAFFVILYATSERNVEKSEQVKKAIEKFLIKAGSFGESGAKIDQGEKNFSVIEPPIQTFRPNKADDTQLMDKIQEQIESQFSEAERKRYLFDVFPDDKGIRIVVSGQQVFAGDSAKFSPDAMAFVNHLGQILKDQKKRVMIEGHVTTGRRGDFPSTWDLASARSVNLLRYMSKKFNFSEKNLAATTFGDTRPLMRSAQSTANANDRLEVLVYFNDTEF